MTGRVLAPHTGAVIGEGLVEFADDRTEGSIYCLLKPAVWNARRDDSAILELENGERLAVIITGAIGPYVIRATDQVEQFGAPVTSFRVRRDA